MHYSFFLTVTPANDVDNPAYCHIHLAAGVLENIKLFFPVGCSQVIRATLETDAVQLLPTNQNSYYSLDGEVVDANLHYDMDAETNSLWLKAWTIGSSYDHTLTLHCEVRGPDEPSLELVMSKILDTIDTLADLIRNYF